MSDARAQIDLNVRVRGGQTFVGYEHCDGLVRDGYPIEVYEQESDVHTIGVVTEIDSQRRLVFIALDWTTLRRREHSHFIVSGASRTPPETTNDDRADL